MFFEKKKVTRSATFYCSLIIPLTTTVLKLKCYLMLFNPFNKPKASIDSYEPRIYRGILFFEDLKGANYRSYNSR